MPGQNSQNPPPSGRSRWPGRGPVAVLTLVAVAVIVGASWLGGRVGGPSETLTPALPGAPGRNAGAPMQVAEGYSVGAPFTLLDHNGAVVRDSDFAGRYMLIFFGYSFCPDICPMELSAMSDALAALQAEAPEVAARIVPIFVTVDPRRDTPEVLHDYVELFHPRLVALTGSDDDIAAMTDAYRVFVRLGNDNADEHYLVDHSSFTYLMGPDGSFVAMFRSNYDPLGLSRSLARIVGDRDA